MVASYFFTYNVSGELLRTGDSSVRNIFTYTPRGLLKSEVQQLSSTIVATLDNTSFDALGRRTQFQVKVGSAVDSTVDYGYSLDGKEITIKQSGTNVASKSVKYTRDSAGRISKLERFADLTFSERVASTEFELDVVNNKNVDRIKSIRNLYGTAALDSFTMTWDASNRLKLLETLSDGSSRFEYDLTNQLELADYSNPAYADLNFNYDANGNRRGSNYTTTADNRLQGDGKATYEYDDNGNLVRRTEVINGISSGPITEYIYDTRDRLTDVKKRTTLTAPVTKQIHYEYDTLNRRVSRSVRSSDTGPYQTVEYFVNDGTRIDRGGAGDNVVLVLDQAGAVKTRLLHGLAVDEVLSEERVVNGVSSDVLWYLADHQGSVRSLVRHDSTAHTTTVVKRIMYDAFGNTIAETNASGAAIPVTDTALAQMYGFTGREFDKETGLQYNRARYYDPSTGRWMSKDPIGFAAGDTNLYRMTGNHPNMATDPSGMIDPAVLQMWSDWVWGKNREVSKAMDSVQRNAPITRIDVHMGAQVIRGVSGYVAHEATVMRGEPGSQQRQGAFAGGFIANSSPVAMYDLYNNPQVVFNRAIGLNDDTELAADSIMQSAESMDLRHANYGHDFVPLFEMEMDAVSSLGMVNSLTTAPMKLSRMSPNRVLKWLKRADSTVDSVGSNVPESGSFRIFVGETLDIQDARSMVGSPLHDAYTNILSFERANFVNPGSLSNDLAGTFAGGRYTAVPFWQDTILYRAGTSAIELGQFFDMEPAQGILQARIDKALLPVWPTGATSPVDSSIAVMIPMGTTVYVGPTGTQNGMYVGGTRQIVVPKPWTIPKVKVIGVTPLK